MCKRLFETRSSDNKRAILCLNQQQKMQKLYHTGTGAHGVCNIQQTVKCNQWMKSGFQSGAQQAVKCNQWMKNGFQSGAQQAVKWNQWMEKGFQSSAHLSIAAQQCDVTLHAAKASSAKVLVYWNYWHYCNCNEIARIWSRGGINMEAWKSAHRNKTVLCV